MKLVRTSTLLLLSILALPAGALQSLDHPVITPPLSAVQAPAPAPQMKRAFPFSQLAPSGSLSLQGGFGVATLSFGARADQLVTAARLKLGYTYSPALLPKLSHIKVFLNDEIMGVFPVDPKDAGKRLLQEMTLDPRFIVDFNTLRLELIGHYDLLCEDPLHSSMWVDISRDSAIELEVQPLPLRGELGLFPEPFFDPRDAALVNLPFIFAEQPSHSVIEAAAVLASWFGVKSEWRGARFPVMINSLPTVHGVIFATNDERPEFLKDQPAISGPTVTLIAHPDKPYVQLLLVMGRDAAELKEAVQGLVLGTAALSGQTARIRSQSNILPRQPYDAPSWVRTDRPTTFAEMFDSTRDLQVTGYRPAPIRLNLNVPADLFTWRSPGIPLELKYRYTPPLQLDESRLNLSINDEFIESFNLQESGQGGRRDRVRIPLLTESLLDGGNEVFIPAFKVGSRNQLQLDFSFARITEGGCKSDPLFNIRAAIDANSTVDFSDFPHYMEMPSLAAYVNSGFPFTRMADLSETALVLPQQPSRFEIEALLALVGRMGGSTGYPALQLSIASVEQQSLLQNKDLLVIGTLAGEALLNAQQDDALNLVSRARRLIAQPVQARRNTADRLAAAPDQNSQQQSQFEVHADGPLGVMVGFESPITPGRSVVALMATAPGVLSSVLDTLDNPSALSSIHGSAAFFRAGGVASTLVGDTYYVGELPFWTEIWYHLSNQPLALALLAVLAVLVIAFALWRALRAFSSKRHQQGGGH